MNFKRKRPKEHVFGMMWEEDIFHASGNHRYRVKVRDLRQPQFTDGVNHTNRPWKYKNNMLR